MKARVTVILKPGVLDPQGKAIGGALKSLGIEGVTSVRQGKLFDFDLDCDPAVADATLRAACEKLLANTVIEDYLVYLGTSSRPEPAKTAPAAVPAIPAGPAPDAKAATSVTEAAKPTEPAEGAAREGRG